ncbi:flavodoxin [Acetonema longum]|uniref:Flavodoxin n=1 Tax=Acetonema longum DSM 6540 TaxID=1009370 RepID=F7NFG2_9FIRM|nr:flavodoxin [Acetonema longum]EGO65217.1 flavodoxin [Acetonema longum DSM 6540]
MKKVTIIYWSGTGNTEMMAQAVKEGAEQGNTVKLLRVEDATQQDVAAADAVAFGCPSMGSEMLEEGYMEPFVASLQDVDFSGKTVALFGSYDWGDGQWMREWADRMKGYGANVIGEGLTIQLTPDADGLQECKALGATLGK